MADRANSSKQVSLKRQNFSLKYLKTHKWNKTMKTRNSFLWLFILLMALPVGVVAARGSVLPEPLTIGSADEDGHSDDEGTHDDEEEEPHDDTITDDHSNDDDNHNDDEVADGHSNDDDHHEEAFTWASLIPLVAGIGVATIASGTSWGLFKHELTNSQLAIMALALITGTVHLLLGLAGDRLLLLNGIGYLGLLGLLFLPIGIPKWLRKLLLIGMVIYTLLTIAGYFYLHSPAQYDALAILSKLVEVVLVIVLAIRIAEIQKAEG